LLIKEVARKPDKRYGGKVPKTERVDAALDLAMRDPEFADQIRAAHALGGFVAATVLCGIFKENCDEWMSDAQNAKNSRLWAGIHFDYDNEEGKNLGIKVGNNILENIK
jgi:hypothetical protein